MDITTWIIIYFPVFILLFVILPSSNKQKEFMRRLQRKRKGIIMNNRMIESLVGKQVQIISGSFGGSFDKVTIMEVTDNWMKVEKKGKIDLINIDFIQNIKIKED
jgi:hypothetical protein